MKRLLLISILLPILISQNPLFSQIGVTAIPYSVTYKLDDIKEFENLPSFDRLKMLKEDETVATSRLKQRRFAKMINLAFHPYNSGTWDETGEGRVWRLGIRSKEAYSLYEVFKKFRLNPGVKLFIYNAGRTEFVGAFTSANNNKANVLAVAPLPGDAIIIELNIPAGLENFGELELSQIGHDYTNEFGNNRLKSASDDPSGSCNVDITCSQGAPWRTEKNAVCRLVANGLLCTGTLINNAASEKIPYLITASHCVQDSFAAAMSLFFFGYERPVCKIHGGEKSYSLSGANLVATTNRELDFSLLKLYEYPPASYNPYFVGWDAGTSAPQGGVCIHHPNGDVKKISVDNDLLTNGDFGEGFNSFTHWVVGQWDVGTTEGGSSGAPFFNTSHKLCGTLTGGDANCDNPVNDFFLQFHRAWTDYPDSSRQLKCWLDPKNTGVKQIDGVYPYGAPINESNIYSNSKDENFTVYKNNLKSGTISGHNSKKYSQFAEKFYASSPIRLSGMYIYIADWANSELFSTFSIKVWEGSGKPTSEIYSQNVYYKNLLRSASNFFYFDSLVAVSDTFFVGYSINYNGYDSLVVYTTIARGPGGSSTMFVYDGTWHNINEVTLPLLNTALGIGVISPDATDPSLTVVRNLKIYPNPCTDYISVEFSDEHLPVSIFCYTTTGKMIPLDFEKKATGLRIITNKLASGIYSLVVQTKTTKWKGKFAVINSN